MNYIVFDGLFSNVDEFRCSWENLDSIESSNEDGARHLALTFSYFISFELFFFRFPYSPDSDDLIPMAWIRE